MDKKPLVTLIILGVGAFVLGVFRQWFARYRATRPRAQTVFDVVTLIVIGIAALSVLGVIVSALL